MPGLVADIGSTNARFSVVTGAAAGRPTLAHTQVLACSDFANIDAAIRHYLKELPAEARPKAGTLAVAAPVTGDAIALTNNKWHFSVDGLRRDLGFERLFAINDFTAISLSLLKLPADGWVEIGPAKDLSDARVVGVIGPGSGLGVGALLMVGGKQVPLPSEGGHVNFAPQAEREWEVARRLTARFGRVSNERLLSGPGLENIVAALHEIGGKPVPKWTAAEIADRALSGEDAVCREALELFCAVLGSAAGDLALLLFADAVFIAGGIVPRFVDFLRQSAFRARFEDKGRFGKILAKVPTRVITEKYAGLIGAAAHLTQNHAI